MAVSNKFPNPDELINIAFDWLQDTYFQHHFFVERDIVWTLHKKLIYLIQEMELPYQVFNDHPILPGNRRSLSVDLCIVNKEDKIQVAIEFKYEPAHNRSDILKTKFPVVIWGVGGVTDDVERVRQYVQRGKAQVAYFIFIDEGGFFRHRSPHPGTQWIGWKNGIWVLFSRVEATETKYKIK